MTTLNHKRKAEDDLHNEQRLTKRFDLLNLDHTGKLYIPVQSSKSKHTPRTNGESNSMHLDDTKNKIYIHNLDDELADIESDEERLVFVPDIEKKLAMIPKSVLLGEGHPATGNEMILYSVPTSLTVPEEQDKVRKAIIESRARAREKQVQKAQAEREGSGQHVNGDGTVEKADGMRNLGHVAEEGPWPIQEDEDAMDIG